MAAERKGSGDDTAELVFGTHAVRHALEHSAETLIELRVQAGRERAAPVRRLLDLAASRGLTVRRVTRGELDSESGYGRHQGIAALRNAATAPAPDLESLLKRGRKRPALFLVLDGVQDPQNLGACVRAADAAGADGVIIPRDRAAPMTAAAQKAASGAGEYMPVIRVVNIARTLREMKDAGIWILGAAGDATQSLYELDLRVPLALVMGGEEKGLRQNVRRQCDFLARLPLLGSVESLNVSVAAGICLYEALRQRQWPDKSGPTK